MDQFCFNTILHSFKSIPIHHGCIETNIPPTGKGGDTNFTVQRRPTSITTHPIF